MKDVVSEGTENEGEKNKKEESEQNESVLVRKHLVLTRELVEAIKTLEAEVRDIEKEEERDAEDETGGKREFTISLKMISDGQWKLLVGCVGLFLIVQLVSYVINLIEVLLRGQASEEEGGGAGGGGRRLLAAPGVNMTQILGTGSLQSMWT